MSHGTLRRGRLVDGQPLVVVVVKSVQGIGIVGHHFKQCLVLVVAEQGLVLDGATQHAHQGTHLGQLVAAQPLVHRIAMNQILLEYPASPLPKTHTAHALDSITDRDNHIQVIECYRLLNAINTQKMRVVISWHLVVRKNIVDMLAYGLLVTIKQCGHLVGAQPHRVVLHAHVNLCLAVFGLIDEDLAVARCDLLHLGHCRMVIALKL